MQLSRWVKHILIFTVVEPIAILAFIVSVIIEQLYKRIIQL